jgi:hypothetical protein
VSVTEKFGCSSVPSPPFTVVNASGPNAPDAATNLYATAISSTEININWQNNPHPLYNETYFEIYRSTSQNGVYSFVGKVAADSSEFKDSKLSHGLTYFYKVRAVNDNGAAPMSNIASAFTLVDKTPPTPPDNLRVVYTTNSTISIQWDSSSDNVGVAKYDVYVNGQKGYSTNEEQFIISGLQKGKIYSVYVKAIDSSGNTSEKSNSVSANASLNGVVYKYYQGYWLSVPDFSVLKPLATGVSPNMIIDEKIIQRNIQFGFLWQGYLNVPATGKYKIGVTSDDGSKLWLSEYNPNATPLVNNDGKHTRSKFARVVWKKVFIQFQSLIFNITK